MNRVGWLVAIVIAGCAPRALTVTPEHPAHPNAAPGRLAGPPPALRSGVDQNVTTPPRESVAPTTSGHEHHEQAPSPDPMRAPAEPTNAEALDTQAEQPQAEPKKTVPKKPKPPTKPKPPSTKPKEPAPPPTGHEGHH